MFIFSMLCQDVIILKTSRTQIASGPTLKFSQLILLQQMCCVFVIVILLQQMCCVFVMVILLLQMCCVSVIVASHCADHCWPLMVMILYVEQAPRMV